MADNRIPLMLFGPKEVSGLGHRLSTPGRLILPLSPNIGQTLQKIRYDASAESFLSGALFSSFIWGLAFFAVFYVAMSLGVEQEEPLLLSALLGLAAWLTFLFLHILYPSIILKKIATKENKDLLFALREIIIDVDGGVPLFDSMKNIALSSYGYISMDFDWAVRRIEGGMPEREALKELALRTESEYLKRAAWQMVNSLESGARMGDSLESIASSVESYLFHEIREYSSNLNFLLLMYMLGGIVAPSLGITFMILLSAFSGLGVTMESVIALLMMTIVVQISMIGYMASARPELFGG